MSVLGVQRDCTSETDRENEMAMPYVQLGTLGSILSEASYMLSSSSTALLSRRYWAACSRMERKMMDFITLRMKKIIFLYILCLFFTETLKMDRKYEDQRCNDME